MKILVIDDKEKNRKSAIDILSEHEVTTIASYDEAMTLICDRENKFNFDVVLLDLLMPIEKHDGTLSNNNNHCGEEVPYGFPLMLAIAMRHSDRVQCITIASDTNHHKHAMSASLDDIGGYKYRYLPPISINGIRCYFLHSDVLLDGSKAWINILKCVLEKQTYQANVPPK